MRRTAVACAGVLTALVLVPATAAAADRYVATADPAAADTANDCSNPELPCATIVRGVQQAAGGETVRVGGGTYNERITLNGGKSLVADDFQGPGGDTGGTAFIDESDGMVTAAIVVTNTDAGTIEGFRIHSDGNPINLNGRAATVRNNTFDQGTPPGGTGAAAIAGANSVPPPSPTIEDNTFTDPTPTDTQAAIAISTGGAITVEDNEISGFRSGIQLSGNASTTATVARNEVSGTHRLAGAGAAIQIVNFNATITDNEIHSPGGGSPPASRVGVLLVQTSFPAGATMRRNEIRDHDFGVRADDVTGSIELDSDLIVGSAHTGVALEDSGTDDPGVSDAEIQNLTVVGQSSGTLAEVLAAQAELTLDASIVGDLGVVGAGTCTATSSRGPGGDLCADSTSDAPGFVDAPNGNYHLSEGSAMIDAGADAPVVAGSTLDFEGDDRVLDGDGDSSAARDIGADEFDPAPLPPGPPSSPDPPGQPDQTDPPAKPADTSVTLELDGRPVKLGKPVKLTAMCPEEPCELTAQASFRIPRKALSASAAARLRTKRLAASLDAGVAQVLKLKPTRKARKAMGRVAATHRREVKVTASATATDTDGNVDDGRLRLKVR